MKGVRFFAGLCLLILIFFIVGNQPVAAGDCLTGFTEQKKDVVEKQSDPVTFLNKERKKSKQADEACTSECVKYSCYYEGSTVFVYSINCGDDVADLCSLDEKDKDDVVSFLKSDSTSATLGNLTIYKCLDGHNCESNVELEKEHAEATLRMISKITGKEFTTTTTQPAASTKRSKPATEDSEGDNSGDDQDNGATQSGIQLLGMAMMALMTRWIYGLL